ncbi:MAG: zinc-ribbon domain containing protein [Gemmataceae bacterium]
MGAGYYTGQPMDSVGVPCDPQQWSEESKRSVANDFPQESYQDKSYYCWRCRTPEVFTAAEQKHTFEVRKANIAQQRILCRSCHEARVLLNREIIECRQKWIEDRLALVRDHGFLRRWLSILETLPEYGESRDEANIVMLGRLLAAE